MLKSDNRPLSVRVERNLSSHLEELLLDNIVGGDLVLLKELDESTFSTISDGNVVSVFVHFNSGLTVEEDALDNDVNSLFEKVALKESIVSSVMDQT
jgi:hypothetical protein